MEQLPSLAASCDCCSGEIMEEPGSREIFVPAKKVERVPFDAHLGFPALLRRLRRPASAGGQWGSGGRVPLPQQDHRPPLQLPHRRPRQGEAAPEEEGASYKQLALIGHLVGFTKERPVRWYELVRIIPLSEAHASHSINRCKDEGS